MLGTSSSPQNLFGSVQARYIMHKVQLGFFVLFLISVSCVHASNTEDGDAIDRSFSIFTLSVPIQVEIIEHFANFFPVTFVLSYYRGFGYSRARIVLIKAGDK